MDQFSQDQDKPLHRLTRSIGPFAKDYVERHRDPVNAALHIVGVPAVVFGLFQATTGRSGKSRSVGLGLIVFGYFLQYLGHKSQGNEVGEVSLIKYLIARTREASRKSMRSHQWFGGGLEEGAENSSEQGEGRSNRSDAVGAGKATGKSTGKSKSTNGNGNGHHGGSNGNGSSGRYILWWKTSH